jgi:uncharacterized membrane protein
MRDAFRALSPADDYRSWFDPFWVRAEPYRLAARPGESVEARLNLRNLRNQARAFRVEARAPAGLEVRMGVAESRLGPEARTVVPFSVYVPSNTQPGIRLVAFDVTVDGERLGEWFDCIVEVR